MWNPKEIDKGKWPDNKTIEFEFEYTGELKIRSVTGSCTCVDVKLEGNKITGNVVPKPVSEVVPSMVTKKQYDTEQHVTVWFSDNSIEVLKIKALIVPHENTIG